VVDAPAEITGWVMLVVGDQLVDEAVVGGLVTLEPVLATAKEPMQSVRMRADTGTIHLF
jgi:hypothetical protein